MEGEEEVGGGEEEGESEAVGGGSRRVRCIVRFKQKKKRVATPERRPFYATSLDAETNA